MSMLMSERRSRRRAAKPSIREVCLLGTSRPPSGWEAGARVSVSGRVYRVAAVQVPPGPRGEPPRYVHLAAEDVA